jgi:twitching motility protein PilT
MPRRPAADYGGMPLDIDGLLEEAVRLGASDVHIKVPSPPRVRRQGHLTDLPGFEGVTQEDVLGFLDTVMRSETARERYAANGSADFSYYTANHRFRVAAFRQRRSPSFVFRVIPEAPQPESLGLPDVVLEWTEADHGLLLITGPTGSGKSTTAAALISRVNESRSAHVLTIEDPVEFLHRDAQALISQREVGDDASSFADALRAALRQDPDVIYIGEVRDEETAMTALRAADTGHLVIATLHAQGAMESIRRFGNLFDSDSGAFARHLLADSLLGIMSQRLVPGADGFRRLNAEVLVNTPRVHDMLTGDPQLSELNLAIAEGDYYGMRSFDQCLLASVAEGTVTEATAIAFAVDRQDLRLELAAQASQPAVTD